MTLDVYRGRKTTMQQQQEPKIYVENANGMADSADPYQVCVCTVCAYTSMWGHCGVVNNDILMARYGWVLYEFISII